jgi:hypothetical protein
VIFRVISFCIFFCSFAAGRSSFAAPSVAGTQIRELVRKTTLTEFSKDLFLSNHPLITSDDRYINAVCNVQKNFATAFLGCYLSGDRGIFILTLPDERLKGLTYSTVAHEILHAAYHRLNENEKSHLRAQLQKVYDGPAHAALEKKLKPYKGMNSDVLLSEMHSFVGSEITQIPDELENYYAKYFRSRKSIVSLYNVSREEFDLREKKIDEFDNILAKLDVKIKGQSQDRKKIEGKLKAFVRHSDHLRKTDRLLYETEVKSVRQTLREYKQNVRKSRVTVAEYNLLVRRRNRVALELRQLNSLSGDRQT